MFHSKHHQCVFFEELYGQAGCASASSALPPPRSSSSSSSRVVNKCGAVSQTADSSRRRPAETGASSFPQPLCSHYAFTVRHPQRALLPPACLPATRTHTHTRASTLPQLSHWICFNKRARNGNVA